jgi:hypothetical protein
MLIAERILVSPLSARHDGGVSPRCERNATMISKEDRRRGRRAGGDVGEGTHVIAKPLASQGMPKASRSWRYSTLSSHRRPQSAAPGPLEPRLPRQSRQPPTVTPAPAAASPRHPGPGTPVARPGRRPPKYDMNVKTLLL